MARTYFKHSIDDLEALLAASRSNRKVLEELLSELEQRTTRRAEKLRGEVSRALFAISAPARGAPRSPPAEAVSSLATPPMSPEPAPAAPDQMLAETAVETAPVAVATDSGEIRTLEAWTALEVLSPQTYNRPEDLAAGKRERIARLDELVLPWEGGGERSLPKRRLYYQVMLGEVLLAPAYEALLGKYADDAPDRPPSKQHAMLAVVVCDKDGVPQEGTVAISSFCWGLPVALRGELGKLGAWKDVEAALCATLWKKLNRIEPDGRRSPLTHETLHGVHTWLFQHLGLASELVRPPAFALRDYQYLFVKEPPEPQLLNSFYLGDLARARELFGARKAPLALQRYLGAVVPERRRDVLRDSGVLADLLAPSRTPPSRWPAPGRAPLVTLQQAAVNAAMGSSSGGVVAVNGPPGTGKTTLLRDVVAAVITGRAEVLAKFDDPEKAFTRTGVTFSRQKANYELRSLAPTLRGFEMVVASSNNKAVENVSAELPGLRAVAEDLSDLRFFASVAEAVHEQPCWGMVAAVLGNAANRYRFQESFWADEDRGLDTYLAVAAGTPRQVEDSSGTTRTPEVVARERPPSGRSEALVRWREARKRFLAVIAASRAQRDQLQQIHELESEVTSLRESLAELEAKWPSLERQSEEAERELEYADSRLELYAKEEAAAELAYRTGLAERPNVFARLFRTQAAQIWASEHAQRVTKLEEARMWVRRGKADREPAQSRYSDARLVQSEAFLELATKPRALAQAERKLSESIPALRAPSGAQVAMAPHAEKQLANPWFEPDAQRKRDEVFIAAMALHRAFIDAAAEPIRHNIAGLLRHLWTGIEGATSELIRDLWASFFLVVPLVSTTFASVETMFKKLDPASLGWLLLDESAQGTPQAAVGAILRAERVVVVGDPMQVEPVVSLPASLTSGVCSYFGIDATDLAAPAASVQALADRASEFTAGFETRAGTRRVGMPLLVHRRCADPMFGISNSVAYENLMVKATPKRESRVGAVLGDSRWLHVAGSARGHWSPEEGEVLLDLIRRLADAGAPRDLYVVSPFRAVANEAGELIRKSPELRPWLEDPWAFARDRVGTIHTVQGREADAVIFVLGAPEPRQQGARAWAGSTPNLLNVAVTRAKERLYVIGNRTLWREAGCFKLLDERLP